MNDERYSLTELAEATGVEPRTIRRYIAEELLKGPEALGRNAYYTQHHLDRLKTIKLLKETYGLPLSEIRRYVHMAGDEQIQVQVVPLAREQGRHRLYSPPQEEEAGFHEADKRGDPRAPFTSLESEQNVRPIDHLVETLRSALGGSRVPRQTQAESVLRLEVTSDITLEIKGRYSPREVAAFEVLADHIRVTLLGGGPGKKV